MSGLYLHSPASEGMRMEAYRSTLERCACVAPSPNTPPLPAFTHLNAKERVMTQPAQHHGINYVEFTTTDIQKSQSFYEKAFSWNFQTSAPTTSALQSQRRHRWRLPSRRTRPNRAWPIRAPHRPLLARPQGNRARRPRSWRRNRSCHLRVSRRPPLPLQRWCRQYPSRLVRIVFA